MMRILRNFVDVKLGLVANWWHCLPRCPMKLRVRSFTPFWLGKPLRLWSIWAHLHSRKKVATRSFEDLLSRRFPEKDASDEMWETWQTSSTCVPMRENPLKPGSVGRVRPLTNCKERPMWVSLKKPGDGSSCIVLAWQVSNKQRFWLDPFGVMKREEIGKAMRSCYPEFSCPKRHAFGAGIVDEGDPEFDDAGDDASVLMMWNNF